MDSAMLKPVQVYGTGQSQREDEGWCTLGSACVHVYVCAYAPYHHFTLLTHHHQVVYSDGDVLCVDLLLPPTHSPISVIGRLTRMGHVASRKKAVKPRPCYPPPCFSLRPGEEVEVVVSSTDSPSSFFVQLVSCHGDLSVGVVR